MINTHKFYNEYVLPVLEEIQDGLYQRGIHASIEGKKIVDEYNKILVKYYVDEGEYYVDSKTSELFSNKFDEFQWTKELVFKELQPKLAIPTSIYDATFIYYIDVRGNVSQFRVTDNDGIRFRDTLIANNNAFLTEEECEKAILKNQAIAKIKECAHKVQGDWTPDWKNHDEFKYFIRYDDKLVISRYTFTKQPGLFFRSRELAELIIEELESECKVMLEVDECTKM